MPSSAVLNWLSVEDKWRVDVGMKSHGRMTKSVCSVVRYCWTDDARSMPTCILGAARLKASIVPIEESGASTVSNVVFSELLSSAESSQLDRGDLWMLGQTIKTSSRRVSTGPIIDSK